MSYTVPNKALLSQLTASSHVSASSFYGDGSNLTNIAAGGLTNVVTNGNITGSGTSGNPVGIKPDPLFNTVTASYFVGDGSKLTNISASAITNVNYLDFNTGINPAFNVGRLHYGTDSGDLEFDLANDNTTLNIGQQLIVKVKNNISPATTLQKGKVVKVSGSQGSSDVLYVITASWENDPGSANTIGLLMTELTGGEIGYVILEGVLQGVNTSAYTAGQMLYLSSSGNMTSSAPTPPNHSVRIGHVARVHENNGSIFVRVQNGYEIDELHDVLISNPQSYDLIVRDADGLWKNTKNLSGSYNFSNSQAIDLSSSLTALRVTQRGSGDVLRVEDSANPDTTPFLIRNDGAVVIGRQAPYVSATLTVQGNLCTGYNTSTTYVDDYSHAEGYATTAYGQFTHAEGAGAVARGDNSHAEGEFTTTHGTGSHAEGSYTNTWGYGSHAEGEFTTTSGAFSHAEGQQTKTINNYSHAEGLMTTASADYQHVQGKYNATSSTALMIVGNGTSDNNRKNILEIYTGSVAVSGTLNISSSLSASQITGSFSGSGALINNITASNINNFTSNVRNQFIAGSGIYIDYSTGQITSSAGQSVDLSQYAKSIDVSSSFASFTGSNVFSANQTITGSLFVSGPSYFNVNSSDNALRITQLGSGNALIVEDITSDTSPFVIKGDGKVGIGTSTPSAGLSLFTSFNQGADNTVIGLYARVQGTGSAASGQGAISEGYRNLANGSYSHAEGGDCTASNGYSHAEGQTTIASGQAAHAEGEQTEAIGGWSHTEGVFTKTYGNNSHAEGYNTATSGVASHAEGYRTETSGAYSHAEGYYTIATADYQHVQGIYNATSSTALMLVGNGFASNSRKNILEVYTGSVVVSGSMYLTDLLSQKPATKLSNSSGSAGQICWDANYIYVCTAINTWKSSSLN